MKAFERVDFNRTLTLSGSCQVATAEPAFVDLAKEMKMPQLMRVAEPFGKDSDVVLAPEEARMLTLFLVTSPWRACFDATLQGMACDDTGSLLTGWLSKGEFMAMLAAADKEPYLDAITSRLKVMMPTWESKQYDEVYFDWYAKNLPEPQVLTQ
jgi:hypothetical protein